MIERGWFTHNRQGSKSLEDHVAEGILEAMVPKQHPVLERDLLRPLDHQLCHLIELGLASWDVPGIDVCLFEGSKPKFSWGSIVGVWTGEEDRQLEPFGQIVERCRGMVGCL